MVRGIINMTCVMWYYYVWYVICGIISITCGTWYYKYIMWHVVLEYRGAVELKIPLNNMLSDIITLD